MGGGGDSIKEAKGEVKYNVVSGRGSNSKKKRREAERPGPVKEN